MGTLETRKIESVQSSITMTILLISFSMLFGTLLMGYMIYRVRATVWPPMGMNDLGILYPTISSILIGLSSLTYVIFEKMVNSCRLKNAKINILLSLLFALGFCASQFLVWNDLAIRGITQSSGIFGSIIYGFTWIHIAHVAVGIALLIWLQLKFKNASPSDCLNSTLQVKNVGVFWHFLGFVWLLLYLILFVF